jgi:hypothetical protein
VKLSCCDHLLGVQRVRHLSVPLDIDIYAESSLLPTLLRIAGADVDTRAEMGQRLLTAMNLVGRYELHLGLNDDLVCRPSLLLGY